MGGAHGHGHPLYYAVHSPVHRLGGHVKIIALLAFMIMVVATPALWYGAFAGYLVVLIMVVAVSPGCLRPTCSRGWSWSCRSSSSRYYCLSWRWVRARRSLV